jgi:hypothetical protein
MIHDGPANIKHLLGRVTLLFDHFLKLLDERHNELTQHCVVPWYENYISITTE